MARICNQQKKNNTEITADHYYFLNLGSICMSYCNSIQGICFCTDCFLEYIQNTHSRCFYYTNLFSSAFHLNLNTIIFAMWSCRFRMAGFDSMKTFGLYQLVVKAHWHSFALNLISYWLLIKFIVLRMVPFDLILNCSFHCLKNYRTKGYKIL